MTINERMNQSFKYWVGIGIPLFVLVTFAAVITVHAALLVPWREILIPAVYFMVVQIVSFAAMYFARKYGKSRDDIRPAILVSGFYGLAIGLLGVYYFAQWGVISQKDLRSNCADFTIVILAATAVTMFLPLLRKS